MKRIFKYSLLKLMTKNTILMPKDAEILSIQFQGKELCIWALIDPNSEVVKKVIEVYGTGHIIEPTTSSRKFITTLQFPNSLVFHFFELIKD